MIRNWILYTLVVTGILLAAGRRFEYAARAHRLPTRWVWLGVIALSTVFSSTTLITRLRYGPVGALRNRASAMSDERAPDSRPEGGMPRSGLGAIEGTTLGVLPGFNEGAVRKSEVPLLMGCGVLAISGLAMLAIAFARLSGVASALDHAVVEGVPVLMSRNIGPALLGVVRARVVLPRWINELSAADVRTILKHEQEHALAADPAVTLAALLMVALQPWNLFIWAAWSRLRLATETDCDARLLSQGTDAREYGRLLINVHQRAQSDCMLMPALVARTSHLERRIRQMTETTPKSRAPRTIVALMAAVALCVLAFILEVSPVRGRRPSGQVGQSIADSIAVTPRKPSYDELMEETTRAVRQADSTSRAHARQ